ncbi:hypothetical protein K457DRAFT_137619 [Linnemannia elongata AG-77]|uniref:Uncharacterized protein n=1 Tax=Linnemannia elongata AG-77 TaxID=1314771 RepID=A0A197JWZ1_9FUNG|nr:hypothetical protein K457DRAFT_137619 [Linnemannia elongata AG-77]
MGALSSRHSHDEPFHSPSESYNARRPLLARFHHHNDYAWTPRPFPTAPVTALVKEARYSIINALDTSLTRDELGSPEIYLALLLPIVRKYREERRETAAVYCFLLNRWQFLRDAENDLANARLNETRAHACEIVATKVLKAFSMRQLIDVLTYDFSPVRRKDGRSRIYLPHFEGEPSNEPMSALEVAISGRAKHFISNPLVQEIINQIWLGEIVFFSNAIDNPDSCLNASQQEIRTVTVYDNRDIKFLRLSRLRVPRYKTTFQMISFSGFIAVYTAVTFAKEAELTAIEVIMDIFALSYTIDELIQLRDSGPSFYFETVWNLFDVPIYIIFLVFMGLRISTFFTGSLEMSDFAYDVLACNAILLWPRLFAALDHYRFFGTMLIVLRQMLLDAMLFLALSLIFYIGFLQAFYGLHDNTKSYGEIAWLLLQVFFGSAFLGFEQADEMSEVFGAPLMVLFVAISVLMLYTLLISIFSQTFSEVSANAKEEFMFLFSVKVMEEVKSDALYEFQPPFNIFAGLVVWPSSLFCSADFVGRISRALLRFFFFPELVCIWIFEVLVLRKQPQYVPVRPGIVEHEGVYGATLTASMGKTSVGGGVAQRRQDRDNSVTIDSMEGQSSRDSTSPPAEARSTDATIFPTPDGPSGHLPTARPTPQELHNLTTNGLGQPGQPTGQEIVSPYFENIRRFRDASKNNSMSSGSLKSDGDNSQERSPYSHHPAIYSYQPAAPIGMGVTRQGSMSGYGRVRHATDMTLANTFQGLWPHQYDMHAVDESATSADPYYQHQHWQQQQQHLHHQQQQQPPNQHPQPPNQRWFMESSEGKQLLQQQQADTEELTRLVEDRFTEMRIRMDEIESKLDRLMGAILGPQDLH